VLEDLIADGQRLLAGAATGIGDMFGIAEDVIDDALQLVGHEHAPGDPTVSGTLERGSRPDAAAVREARLDVPGDVDHARAKADAERTLASIDFSRPNISLWVPATGSHAIPSSWRSAVEQGVDGQRTSLALVDYPASFNFNDSVSTGMETLRLVLAGIAERGGQHRVTLAGHSQGAWVIGDAIDAPELARSVDRAVLYGHPAPARVDWSKSGDPNVRQVDDAEDPFTFPLDGGRQALAALDELHEGRDKSGGSLDAGGWVDRIGTLARTALANPQLSAYLVGKHVLPPDDSAGPDPHHYDTQYADGARFLNGA
jgi:hypothetical protein